MSSDAGDKFLEGLQFVAPYLNAACKVQNDAFRYDAITEAILWEDEIPEDLRVQSESLWGLRPILRYRASLILNEPDAAWEGYWVIAKAMFPQWVGFNGDRVNPTAEVRKFLRANLDDTRQSIQRMQRRATRRK